jgi:uncharacterized repeat protein (TIGR03803 family)
MDNVIGINARLTVYPALAVAACLSAATTLCQAASEKVIYAFAGQADGNGPSSPLIQVGGKFYGTTGGGGTHNRGTVFSVDTAGNHVVLYNFKENGTASWQPAGGLVELGGILYGVTVYGGIEGDEGVSYGTVFSITPQGAYKQIYEFKGPPTDGNGPFSGLVVLGNLLYGTTSGGGQNGYGTVFSITPEGSESLLYSFENNSDGYNPTSLMTDGTMLYGTTEFGAGTDCDYSGCGAVFMLDPQGNETTLYSFGNGAAGGNPYAPLLKSGTLLYGSTVTGGSNNLGTVFSLSLTGAYKDLHNFKGTDGEFPLGLVNVGGTLYGTAQRGGPDKNGTVFSMTKKGKLTTIYSFQGGRDGIYPGNLLAVSGTLYGTTQGALVTKCFDADPPDCGTVFAVTP